MPPVSFNEIPSNLRVPLAYMEVDGSRALTGLLINGRKLLVMGQQRAGGTAAANTLQLVSGPADAEAFWGVDSQIAEMFRRLKKKNPYVETYGIGVAENGAGVAATGNLSITGPATAAGTLCVYIGDTRILVGVATGDTATEIAAALVAACGDLPNLQVTATVNGVHDYQVDLVIKGKGAWGNDMPLSLNLQTGDRTPAGVAVAITPFANGATNPSIAGAIAVMGNQKWNTIALGFNDDANMDLIEAELDDRWGPMSMKAGRVYAAFRGTLSATNTYGAARNSKHSSVTGTGLSPTPPWAWAAVVAVTCEASLAIDPARPVQFLALDGCSPAKHEDEFILSERNTLLYDGISTVISESGQSEIEQQITTYQTNPAGAADPTYLFVETMECIDFYRTGLVQRILIKFPRHKLASDGTKFGPGQAIVTPEILRKEMIAFTLECEAAGIVENVQQFIDDLDVDRDPNNPNRVNFVASPDFVNQFRLAAGQLQFIL